MPNMVTLEVSIDKWNRASPNRPKGSSYYLGAKSIWLKHGALHNTRLRIRGSQTS